MKNKIWFVTGASKGLGLVIVQKLLKEGYQVAATSRNRVELEKAVGVKSNEFLPLQVDLVNESSVQKAIAETVTHFGRLDVIVNNAGYGTVGALEELSDAEVRKNFDVNVFGLLNVTRQALPYLRKQQSGHIFNISSVAGFTGLFPGFGIYCATKFAVTGLTESLNEEIKDFGIHATIVAPGYFRTNFLDAGSLVTPQHEMAEYKNVREVQAFHQHNINGEQPGDPEKLADVLIEVSLQQQPPLHLFLGQDAYEFADAKIQVVQQDMKRVKALATSTGYESRASVKALPEQSQ
jgi:NAD(P)-dependent dehydrogenase (short-subunit alcohol dehydrogenase family)